MVEVKAQVVGGPVLLAGDIVQVTITVKNPALDPASMAQSSEVNEVVAWGSAQIHCVCTVNENKVNLSTSTLDSTEDHAVTNAATSFAPWRGEGGHLVLATKPKILFCDLQLLPGNSKTFLYRERIPMDAPPSHRGQLVKYAYKVTVGTQKLGSSISLLRLPIRVIVLPGLSDACIYSDSEELGPSNPFLRTLQPETPRHTALQIIQNVSARKNVSQYNITNARGHVVKFTIYKNSFRLGEDILATFDFTAGELPCVQYSVTLQSEEQVSDKYQNLNSKKSTLMSYSKTHEICLTYSHTHFLLPIPLHLTPTFSTDLVSLKWRLHFEFVLDVSKDFASDKEEKEEAPIENDNKSDIIQWAPKEKLNIETLVWDLPITVFPSSPNQLAQALGLTQQKPSTSS